MKTYSKTISISYCIMLGLLLAACVRFPELIPIEDFTPEQEATVEKNAGILIESVSFIDKDDNARMAATVLVQLGVGEIVSLEEIPAHNGFGLVIVDSNDDEYELGFTTYGSLDTVLKGGETIYMLNW